MSDDAFTGLVILCLVLGPIALAWLAARLIWPERHDKDGDE